MSGDSSSNSRSFAPRSLIQYINKGNIKLVWQSIKAEGLISTLSKIGKTAKKHNKNTGKILEFKPVDANTVIFKYYPKPKMTMILLNVNEKQIPIIREINNLFDNLPIEIIIINPDPLFNVMDYIKGVKIIEKQLTDCIPEIMIKTHGDRYMITNTKKIIEFNSNIMKMIDFNMEETIIISDNEDPIIENKKLSIDEIEKYYEKGNAVFIKKEQILLN